MSAVFSALKKIKTPSAKKSKLINGFIVVFLIIVDLILIIKVTNWHVPFALEKKQIPLTELYFSDHLNLPRQITVGKPYQFEFNIRNLEFEDITYSYEVKTSVKGVENVLSGGEVFLRSSETKNTSVSLLFPKTIDRAKVIVKLVNKNQEISFWVNGEI